MGDYEIPDSPNEWPELPPQETPYVPQSPEPILPDTPEPEPVDPIEPSPRCLEALVSARQHSLILSFQI